MKNMTKKYRKFFISRGIALFMALILVVTFAVATSRMLVTATQLFFISCDIRLMQSDSADGTHGWEDWVVESYNSAIAKRDALCNSESKLVSTFASSGHLTRAFMLLVSITALVFAVLNSYCIGTVLVKAVKRLNK